jgi:chorismate mutase/prephenate dehydratase
LLSKSTNKNNIKNLFSHPQSLAQCRKWINNNTPNSKLIPMLSNSEGAIQVKTNNDACIGPNTLSDYYDLTLVESNIQDFENNQTRFLILGKSIHYSLNESKTSIIIIPQTESRSGSLYNLLKPFSDNNVNLTRIESRPLKTHNWKYSFFIDFEGSYKDKNVINAIDTIKNNNNELKFLGSYKPSL